MATRVSSKNRLFNMVYSLGAAIVIIGALFKLTHFSLGFLTGGFMLTVGLLVEAAIFTVAAFDPPSDEYEWERVYPELTHKNSTDSKPSTPLKGNHQDLLAEKLDDLFNQAKLDVNVMERLRDGILNFSHSVEGINKVIDTTVSTQKYGDQLTLAASHMESLNALYQVQLEQGKQQAEINKEFVDDMKKSAKDSKVFMEEVDKLSKNLSDLNKIYGGMLNAMKSQS